MILEYLEQCDMWIYKETKHGNRVEVRVTEWTKTSKGPLIDFAIFIGNGDEARRAFFDVEVLTDTVLPKQIPQFCKQIMECYDREKREIDLRKLINVSHIIFKKCDIDAYHRTMGDNCRMMIYIKKRYHILSEYETNIFYEGINKQKKLWKAPALKYPGTRDN